MTRINCVPVEELPREYCFAEYRELPRIRHMTPRLGLPSSYRMGAGHVLFFLNKGAWLMRRHRELLQHLQDRWGYAGLSIPPLILGHWPDWALGDWTPDEEAISVNRQRIKARLKADVK